MFSYKQSIYETEFKYLEDSFEYFTNLEDGERLEYENNRKVKINTCKSLFLNSDIKFSLDQIYLEKLKKILTSTRNNLLAKNIYFSSYMKLHNEKVLIDNKKEDDRSYNLFRLILKNNNNNIYIEDLSIVENSLDKIEEEINYFINKNLNKIKMGNSKSKKVYFDTIPVVLSSQAAGYFLHEIIGHILEEDFFSYYKNMYQNLEFSKNLTVVESAEPFKGLIDIKKYDDTGVVVKPLTIIKNGNLENILAINKNKSFNNELYGFARRENYKSDILPRMRGIFINPHDVLNENQIIEKYENAIFVENAYLGGIDATSGNYNITGNGFKIKNGEKQNFIGNLKVSGNILKDVKSFEYIGNEMRFFASFCKKMDQAVRVGIGGVPVSMLNLTVEGDLYEKP